MLPILTNPISHFYAKISALRERVSAGGGGGGGGEGVTFSSYVGSGPASTTHPKKYQEFQAPIFFLNFSNPKHYPPPPHSVP